MESSRLNSRLSLLGMFGVIAGLVLVAYELRQNSELMRIQINQARADAAMASNEQLFNSDYMPKIVVKASNGENLTPVERVRFVSFFRSYNRNQDNVLTQYQSGMLGDATPRSVADYACDFVGASEEHRQAWERTKVGYSDSYVVFIEDSLNSCD